MNKTIIEKVVEDKFIVGLTGGIGSGKSTITDMLAKLNVDIVDADIVAREVVAPHSIGLTAIAEHFGKDFILANGELNRTLLRTHIFSDPAEKEWLNNLLHPMIRNELLRQISQTSSDYCVLVAPLLFENNLHSQVDHVVVVDVSEETQVARTCARDKNSPTEVKRIIASQISRNERLRKADTIINNDPPHITPSENNLNKINQEVVELDMKLRRMAINMQQKTAKGN